MGANQSTYRSTPKSTKPNLLWALEEAVHWEEEASIAKLLLAEASAYRPGQTSLGSISALDDASRARAIDLLKKMVDLTFVRIDLLLKNGTSKFKDFPVSHPARATLASRTFAAAATENLASNIDALVMNNPAIFTAANAESHPPRNTNVSQPGTSLNPPSETGNAKNAPTSSTVVPTTSIGTGTTIIRNSETTVIEGPIDLKNTQTATPPALGASDINAGQAFTPEKLAQQERVEIAAKFLFIYSLLMKTVACAQHTYKLSIRTGSLRKALKPKRTAQMDDVILHSLRESHTRSEQSLTSSLANFDRARAALVWLRRDYEIAYASHRCNELLRTAHKLRDTMTYDDDARADREVEARLTNPITSDSSTSLNDTLYDPRAEQKYSAEINEMDNLINTLKDRNQKLELSLQENERNALNVAFDYLDSNGRGQITHEQCPQLGDHLWRVVDTHTHGKITRSSMLQGIDNLSKKIDSSHIRIMDIERDNSKTHRLRSDLSQLKAEFRSDRATLRQLNQYFYKYFVEAVFTDMDGSVRQETVDIANLQKDIHLLEQALTASVDPLSGGSDSNTAYAFSDSSVTGAANMIVQHKQLSQKAIDAHQHELVKEDRIIAGPSFTKAETGIPGTGGSIDKEASVYGIETRSGFGNAATSNVKHSDSAYSPRNAPQDPYSAKQIYEQTQSAAPVHPNYDTTSNRA